VNQYQTAEDFPEDYPPLKDGDKKWSRGGSSIVSPLGIVLAGPLWDKEGIITAEVRVLYFSVRVWKGKLMID
jgi:nitrilase